MSNQTVIIADFFALNKNANNAPFKTRLNIVINGMSPADTAKLTDGNGYAIVKNNVLDDLQNQVNNHFKSYGMNIDLQVVRFVAVGFEINVCATIEAFPGLFYQVS